MVKDYGTRFPNKGINISVNSAFKIFRILEIAILQSHTRKRQPFGNTFCAQIQQESCFPCRQDVCVAAQKDGSFAA